MQVFDTLLPHVGSLRPVMTVEVAFFAERHSFFRFVRLIDAARLMMEFFVPRYVRSAHDALVPVAVMYEVVQISQLFPREMDALCFFLVHVSPSLSS